VGLCESESESESVSKSESERTAIRRVLFIGPSGGGKSTLINVLFNKKVTADAMSGPAATGDTSTGQTTFFITYHDFPDNAYTDSIGLGDPRFKAENVMDSLKSVLEMASIGYNKIYICLQYGRISADTRRYIELITTVFGKSVLKWSSIIFTHCNDETMTKEKYLRKNSEDTDIVAIINQVKTVRFGDNMTDENREMDNVLHRRREDFHRRIRQDLDNTSKREYFQLPKRNLITRAQAIVKILFGSLPKVNAIVSDIKMFARAVAAAMHSSKYRNYFGECSICMEDVTDANQPVMTQCSHVYHEACLMRWVRENPAKSCPICRTTFNDQQQNFYIILTADV
jgi:nicotinamide riboside kinase